MKVVCEYCGKEYSNYQDAVECEKKCGQEKEEKEKLLSQKKERLDLLKKEIENFNKDYNECYYMYKARMCLSYSDILDELCR